MQKQQLTTRTMMTAMLLFFVLNHVQAQPSLRVKTRQAINRTVPVLKHARDEVKKGKVYTGDLAKAIAHQEKAIELWRRKVYRKAYLHTRRARVLSIQAIKANNGAVDSRWLQYGDEEELKTTRPPSDMELDHEIQVGATDEQLLDKEIESIE